MKTKKIKRGFSLIELIVGMALVAILALFSISALQPGKSKFPVRGLAMALQEQFQAARQLAIATGKPVALGIPTDQGQQPRASSIYRLEGWNKPIVSWSQGYKSDYPEVVFFAAGWGDKFKPGVASSPLLKFSLFNIEKWIPKDLKLEHDYIFCYTPDGQLVTNGLPALDGRYTVVVASAPSLEGEPPGRVSITGAQEAITLFISPSGGVELVTGMPDGPNSPAPDASSASSMPQGTTAHKAGDERVRISNIHLLPTPDESNPDDAVCVPGQVVTMEVYAYDPEGRALFSKWTQKVVVGDKDLKGQFSYPYSDTNTKLVGEVERMEFVYDCPDTVTWPANDEPKIVQGEGLGFFRARWNWTVPVNSKPGDVYSVEADVRDVKGEVTIKNPAPKKFPVAKKGRILLEQLSDDGTWQLVTMNPDGSGKLVLSNPGFEECMPSLDRSSSKMAFLQGKKGDIDNRYVKVRGLHGGQEKTLAGPGRYTSVSMSPDGTWVAYRDDADATKEPGDSSDAAEVDAGKRGRIYVQSLENLTLQPKSKPQRLDISTGHKIKKTRSGWSQNCKFMLYEAGGLLWSMDLASGTSEKLYATPLTNTIYGGPGIIEHAYAPVTYRANDGSERLLFSLGNNNPVLISVPIKPENYRAETYSKLLSMGDLHDYKTTPSDEKLRVDYGGNGDGTDNDYPDISADGNSLVFTRSKQTSAMGSATIDEDVQDQTVMIVARSGDNFLASQGLVTMKAQNVRRAVWIPAEQEP